jgi:hypothetical protein
MNEKRKKTSKKFTDMLRPWIVARDMDGNVVIGREVIEGIRDSGRTKRCLVINAAAERETERERNLPPALRCNPIPYY